MTAEADGKVIALFGAGPGLGAAVAHRFGREGYRVALVARRGETLRVLAEELAGEGVEAVPFPADLSRSEAIPDLVADITARLGPIGAVYYAPTTGESPFLPATEVTPQILAGYVDLYLYSPIAVVNAVLPGMLGRGDGAILVGHGGSAAHPAPFRSGIGPIMSATRNYLYSLHGELAGKGVYVGTVTISAVILGSTGAAAVDTELIAQLGLPTAEPSDLADLLWNMADARDRVEVAWPAPPPESQS
ncbi:SDR family NAD(P)-dependent oxidoreductase [Streptomyces malaysiensis]|uniref:SDR family NAD(P)-dependent oxidoreductase n=1 Tax=Streptomyces malaysiensis TaxID=92644 RepID=UPI000853BCB1|nr:SDR family NAD(P)-dependent oxidoreductase [Streptomyces sp. SPMA113]